MDHCSLYPNSITLRVSHIYRENNHVAEISVAPLFLDMQLGSLAINLVSSLIFEYYFSFSDISSLTRFFLEGFKYASNCRVMTLGNYIIQCSALALISSVNIPQLTITRFQTRIRLSNHVVSPFMRKRQVLPLHQWESCRFFCC